MEDELRRGIVFVSRPACVHIYIYIQLVYIFSIYIYVCMYIYIYIHIYTHTHTQTHTHTYGLWKTSCAAGLSVSRAAIFCVCMYVYN